MKAHDIETAIVKLFDPRRNIIVPRVTYIKGAFNHECDLIVLSQSGYATEIEIKTSVPDLKKDFAKKHGHDSKYIRRLFYAMPAAMQGHSVLSLIPDQAGIIFVHEIPVDDKILYRASINKPAKNRRGCLQFTTDQRILLLRNVQIKFWSLITKQKIDLI